MKGNRISLTLTTPDRPLCIPFKTKIKAPFGGSAAVIPVNGKEISSSCNRPDPSLIRTLQF
jgi:hypothetical protein